MQYFSQRYFTTLGGSILVRELIWFASKKARSVFSQRRKVAALTPAASASSNLVIDFILLQL
jgi:hypothetical protein